MRVRFWGVRGSVATPMETPEYRRKLRAALALARERPLATDADLDAAIDALPDELRCVTGGNTACVSLEHEGELLILDAGTGIRPLGVELMRDPRFAAGQGTLHLVFSHYHIDHVKGFPFFMPAYIPGNTVHVYACHPDPRRALADLMQPRFFPVPLDGLGATLHFHALETEGEHAAGGFRVRAAVQDHPGGSFTYRVSAGGKTVVYATDHECKDLSAERYPPLDNIFSHADVLIFDAQYTFEESLDRRDWGHSTCFVGAGLALQERIQHLVLFHHDPMHDDFKLTELLHATDRFLRSRLVVERHETGAIRNLRVSLAREGLALEL